MQRRDYREDEALRPYFERNERLSAFLLRFFASTRIRLPPRGAEPAQVVLTFAIAKAHRLHRAIILLCAAGFAESAAVVLRSLFELALDSRYVGRDTSGERAERWLDYDWVVRYEHHQTVQSDPYFVGRRGEIEASTTEEIEREARRVQQRWKFWRKERDGDLRSPVSHWSGKGMVEIARQVGWESHFNTVYRLTSSHAHTHLREDRRYIGVDDAGRVQVLVSTSSEGLENILAAAHPYLHLTALEWAKVMNPPDEMQQELRSLIDEWVAWTKERLGPDRVAHAEQAARQQGDID